MSKGLTFEHVLQDQVQHVASTLLPLIEPTRSPAAIEMRSVRQVLSFSPPSRNGTSPDQYPEVRTRARPTLICTVAQLKR